VNSRLGNVFWAEVEVAVKYSDTVSPTTESLAYGEVVPMPKLPVVLSLALSLLLVPNAKLFDPVGVMRDILSPAPDAVTLIFKSVSTPFVTTSPFPPEAPV